MALDPIILNAGVGGDSIGSDNVGGVNYEVVKQAFGTEGSLTLVDASHPLPVTDALGSTAVKQSDGSQKTQVVDGSGNVIGATSNALDVNIKSGNPTTITVTQGTGTNLHTVVDAGSAIIGKVGIDQTTPGTTNGVQVNAALPAGANAIGKLAANSGVTIGAVEIAAAQTLATVTTVGTVTTITNNVNTVEVAPTTILNGKTTVTTAGTRVVLASSTTCKSVTIKALTTNTGLIYVGNATVASTNGFQLAAGDSISMDIANLNTVNIDSAVNGEGVTYIGIN